MNLKSVIKQYPATSFIVLTMVLSFAAFLLPTLLAIPQEGAFSTVVFVAVNFPTVVALILAGVIGGRSGLMDFLRECFRWKSPSNWYLLAVLVGALVPSGGVVITLLSGTISTISIATPSLFVIFIFVLALLEEIGWRGFALHYLLDQFSPVIASLIVGIPWAFFHFALWLVFVPEVSPIAEGCVVLVFAMITTWIYIRSGRNVIVATVAHGAFNAAGMLIGTSLPAIDGIWYYLISVCLIAVVLLVIDWRMWFAQPSDLESRSIRDAILNNGTSSVSDSASTDQPEVTVYGQ